MKLDLSGLLTGGLFGLAIGLAMCVWSVSHYTLVPNAAIHQASIVAPMPGAPRHASAPTAYTSEEGWLIVSGVTPAQMYAMCPSNGFGFVQGCANWSGPLFLGRPSENCIVLMSNRLDEETYKKVLELEKRHCREGAYHDVNNKDLPKELRDQMREYVMPGITVGSTRGAR